MNANEVFITLTRLEYNPGEVVSGAILVRLDQPIRATGILLKLTGRERSAWIDTNKGQAEPVVSHRHYFKTLIQVATFSANDDHIGEYRFPFSFTLPRNIPGSRVFEFGTVSSTILYKIKAIVEQLGVEKSDIKYTQAVYVKQINPLNQILGRNDPPGKYCLCMQQPGLAIELTPAKAAFQAGDVMRLIVSINNGTNHLIDLMTICLRMHVNLASSSWSDVTLGSRKQYSTDHVIGTAHFPSIKAKGVIPYCELALPIPASMGQQCFGHTIRIYYSIEVRASMKGVGASLTDGNLLARIPVAIYAMEGGVAEYSSPGAGFHPKTYQGIVGHLPSSVPTPASFPMYLFSNIAPITSSNPGPQKTSEAPIYPGKEFAVADPAESVVVKQLPVSPAPPPMQTVMTAEAGIMTEVGSVTLSSAEVSSLLSPGNLTFGGEIETHLPYYSASVPVPLIPTIHSAAFREQVPPFQQMEQVAPQSPITQPTSPMMQSKEALDRFSAITNLIDKFAAA